MKPKKNIALIGMFAFFFLLFNAPFITIPMGSYSGIPRIIIYIGAVWMGLIILMIVFSSKTKSE